MDWDAQAITWALPGRDLPIVHAGEKKSSRTVKPRNSSLGTGGCPSSQVNTVFRSDCDVGDTDVLLCVYVCMNVCMYVMLCYVGSYVTS